MNKFKKNMQVFIQNASSKNTNIIRNIINKSTKKKNIKNLKI